MTTARYVLFGWALILAFGVAAFCIQGNIVLLVVTVLVGACWTFLSMSNRSAFLTAILIFFTLGFWVKPVFAVLTGTEYIEPTGDFNWSMDQWTEAFEVVAAGFAGLAVAMLVSRIFRPLSPPLRPAIGRTSGYKRIELPLAILTGFAALVAFGANWYFGFDKIGIEHAVIVPRPVFIIVSFTILWGAALWLACMGYWAWSAGRLSMTWLLVLGLLEGLLAGVSNASRSRYIFHAMGFMLGWFMVQGRTSRSKLAPLQKSAIGIIAVALLALSLVLVSSDRMTMYAQGGAMADNATDSGSPNETGASAEKPVVVISSSQMAVQIGRLFIARWIGMEGVMSVVGYDHKGSELFYRGVTERKDAGNDGLYESISHSVYKKLPGIMFLTTAGSVAVLYYSGSLLVVFFGVLLLALVGMTIERASLYLTQSPFASSIMAVMFANFICQVNQPVIPFKFTLIMLMACCLIWAFRVSMVRLSKATA